jgi:hypothetical protein
MKTLKITTHWSAEETDTIYRLLHDLQSAIWQSYGEYIEEMYRTIRQEQQEREAIFFDDIPF